MDMPAPVRVEGRGLSRVERAYAKRLPLMRKVCRRMSAGASLAEVCHDPMLPLAVDVCRWAAEDPRFAQMLTEARAAGGTGHLARPARPGIYSDELAEEFLRRLVEGRGLIEVCAADDMPSHTTIYRWLAAKPKFALAYREARHRQADLLFDLAWMLARQASEGNVKVARLMLDTIKWRCSRLHPRAYLHR